MKDEEMLDGIVSGQQAVFSIFFNTYWKDFYTYLYRMLQDEEESTDILQDTFTTIWENRQKLGNVQSLKAYVYRIIHYKAVKAIRYNVKLRNLKDELYSYFPQHGDNLTEEVDVKELADLINQEIQNLPPRMREIFMLSRNEQLSYREIAEQLAISENTVKKQVSTSIKQLKQRIDSVYIAKSVSAVTIYKAFMLIDKL